MTATTVLDRPSRPGAPSALGPALVDAYLCRLGVSHEPPVPPAAPIRLHRAHVERVPYETFWLHLGDDIGTDPVASAQRIAMTDRVAATASISTVPSPSCSTRSGIR